LTFILNVVICNKKKNMSQIEKIQESIKESQQQIESIQNDILAEGGWENIAPHSVVTELKSAINKERSKIKKL
jgi:hypothetical protein